ncbi:MAG TPA: DUF4976 domain-containing protein, partial [Pseudomonadales bacterium]|nr:DUF4976 domain-containing protein [Pseudomonadales bacterium]
RDMVFAEQHDHGLPINKRAARDGRYLYIINVGENKNNCVLEAQPMGKEMIQAFVEKKLNRTQLLCFLSKPAGEELYDVEQDPLQLHNLAADPAKDSVRLMMKKRLDAQVF